MPSLAPGGCSVSMRSSFILVAAFLVGCGSSSSSGEEEEEVVAAVYPDADGDTILDFHEGAVVVSGVETTEDGGTTATGEGSVSPSDSLDTDLDGEPDYLDLDADNDGIPDAIEAGDTDVLTFPVDSDLDGIADFMDLDSDGNCLGDGEEGAVDTDGDGLGDFTDRVEVTTIGVNRDKGRMLSLRGELDVVDRPRLGIVVGDVDPLARTTRVRSDIDSHVDFISIGKTCHRSK